jgi:phenylacetate-coenzyme A ligase PaaK-like adenylate-forming protein
VTATFPLTPLESWIARKIGRAGHPFDRHTLRAYQLAKLNETLSLARRKSRFYKASLVAVREELRSLDELAELPFSSADDLRAAPLDFVCVSPSEVDRIVTLPTSGTTGPPKRIYFTGADQELTRDFFHHGMSTMVEPGDRVLILLPGSTPGSVGDLLREGLARMDVLGIPHGPVLDAERTLTVMGREQPTALVGVPVQVLTLARLASARGISRPSPVHSVLLSTDRVPPAVVQAIEKTWDCRVYNHWGMTETGLGGGVDCRARTGYHLREADLLVEIVEPATGRVLPDGETGEVVVTTLTREAMPLVRYRTGDVSSFIPGPCPCGTALKTMAHVHERLAGHLELPGGAVVRQRDFDEALLPLEGLLDFRVLASEDADNVGLVVEVRRLGEATPRTERVIEALSSMPPLARALARGGLAIVVKEWDPADNAVMGKRRIVHQGGIP